MPSASSFPQGWLVGPDFDRWFIFGTLGIAVAGGVASLVFPALFLPVIALNLWLLGYHHVIATFTRLCFDRQSHRQSRLLLYALGPLMALFAVGLVMAFGLWTLAAVYLYGQWFHYSRQSWGISRAYERNAPPGYAADRSWQTQAAFYSLPLLGILYRSYQAPQTFLALPVKVLPVSGPVVGIVAAFCLFFFVLWLVRIWGDWRRGVLPKAYAYYMFTHFGLFSFAYLVMPTLNSGWLVANIWHNLQYLMFVWMYNNRTYRDGITSRAPLLSFLSQKRNTLLYFGVTLGLATVIYMGVTQLFSIRLLWAGAVPLTVVYMAINFHHYIVDAIIWRASWIKRGRAAAAA